MIEQARSYNVLIIELLIFLVHLLLHQPFLDGKLQQGHTRGYSVHLVTLPTHPGLHESWPMQFLPSGDPHSAMGESEIR